MEELTEQELDKLWLDMSFTRDYITNKYVYRKLRDNYVCLQQENTQLKQKLKNKDEKISKAIEELYKVSINCSFDELEKILRNSFHILKNNEED